jgi:coenzyme F420-dependent glucose-6-phosphate dehydrogenase
VRLGWWLSSEEHDPRELVRHAVAAERAGVATAMISDHLQPWSRAQGQSSFVWTVVGAIAQATDHLEVGTGVVSLVYRNSPVVIAQAAATAAVMLEGRFFLGVGSGERLNEQPLGLRWPRAGERLDRLGEAIEVMQQLWQDKAVNHRGEHWVVENLRLMTRPAQAPPVYVAAGGTKTAALAGELGDGLIGVTPDAHVVDVFNGSGGGGKPCLAQLHISLASSTDQARENAFKWWPNGVVPPSLNGELAKPADFDAIAQAIGPDRIDDTVVCAADAAPIIDRIDRFVGAGFDTVYLHQVGPDQQRLVDLVAAELLPHYRS